MKMLDQFLRGAHRSIPELLFPTSGSRRYDYEINIVRGVSWLEKIIYQIKHRNKTLK